MKIWQAVLETKWELTKFARVLTRYGRMDAQLLLQFGLTNMIEN